MNQTEESLRYLLRFKQSKVAWFVLVCALIVTAALWALSLRLVADRTKARFENQSLQLKTAIEERLLNYEQVLAGSAGLFAVADLVGKEDWHTYVNKLNIDRYYPGIQGIGYTQRIVKKDLPKFLEEFSSQDLPSYLLSPSHTRLEYHPVVFLEPRTSRNKRAYGFDPFSDPTHREAMEKARDSGKVAVTAKVVLVQESLDEEQPGFVMYFPVYENDKALDLPDQRQDALLGFVFSAFRMNNLMDGIVGLIAPFLDIHIYDSDVPQREEVMYASNLGTLDNVFSFKMHQSLEYGGRTWLLETRTTPAFDYLASDTRPNWVLGSGILVSLLLFVVTLAMLRSRLLAVVNSGKYRAITEHTETMTLIFGADGNASYVSPSCQRILGVDYAKLNKVSANQLVHPDDWPTIQVAFEDITAGKRHSIQHIVARVKNLDGEWVDVEGALTGMLEVPGVSGVVGNFRDVSDLRKAQSEMRKLAYYDPLTGLANRQLFKDRLDHAIKSCLRRRTSAALLYLDLDGFKGVNDTLGHDAGDKLLKQVAGWLSDAVREEDSVARMGGDEFTILLTEVTDASAAGRVAENVLQALTKKVRLKEHEVAVSGSIGIAMIPSDSDVPETAMKFADLAMYRAKELGRNNFQFFTSALNIRAARHMLMLEELRSAIDLNQLRLFYQPKIEIDSQKVVGLEVLLRWSHPDRGIVEPNEFMGVAEESGIILAMGEWVIRQACLQLLAMKKEFGALKVSINLSSKQLMAKNFLAMLEDTFRSTGFDSSDMEIEIRPEVIKKESPAIMTVLNRLSQKGVSIVLDDFGLELCSMDVLNALPVSAVKLDQEFTCSKIAQRDCENITSAVIAMARKLGLKVIAEGVDNPAYLNFLRENRCNYAQGYLITPPLSEEAISGFLATYGSAANQFT